MAWIVLKSLMEIRLIGREGLLKLVFTCPSLEKIDKITFNFAEGFCF